MGNPFSKPKEEEKKREYYYQHKYAHKDFEENYIQYIKKNIVITHNKAYVCLKKRHEYGIYYIDMYEMFNVEINGFNTRHTCLYDDFPERIINAIKDIVKRPFVVSVVDNTNLDYPLTPFPKTWINELNDNSVDKFYLVANFIMIPTTSS